jgi:hypothetical protein
MSDAFFVPQPELGRFLATPHTAGLWSPTAQHAGPPSALLARAIEHTPTTCTGPVAMARFTTEILGSVPVGEVTVRARVARPGRSVELVEAELTAAGRTAMLARAWRIRRGSAPSSDDSPTPEAPPPRPPSAAVYADPTWRTGYLGAVDWRYVAGSIEQRGPARVWARQRIPLVAAEETTPVQRLLTLADSGNGLSGTLDFTEWWFINTELTVHFTREPRGEWMYVDARTRVGDAGAGTAHTDLFDESGRVGTGAQALFFGRRT